MVRSSHWQRAYCGPDSAPDLVWTSEVPGVPHAIQCVLLPDEPMTDLYADALVMLKRLEWCDNWYEDACCPVCGRMEEVLLFKSDTAPGIHRADCELYALIKKMESTPMECRPVGTAVKAQAAAHGTTETT